MARNLISQVQQTDAANRSQLLELVERMLIYKFSISFSTGVGSNVWINRMAANQILSRS
ncbi:MULTISPECIES: Rpn family recombination-promoting nuclease/putative transposase [Nostocales]|uniref:Uncharacterized protein n=2 Tax=Nostocales TaxID=1161 RepID=A0ABW8WI75_9CYAN|nr:Rpn family recombination-promoting nuclease/putative transposase [Tolypothrix bouteillei]